MKGNYHSRIKEVREKKKYTQEFMADSLKISQRAYSSIENGQTQLTIDRLFEISSVLETPVSELIGAEGTNVYNNSFNNHATNNKGNLIFNQTDYEALRSLYERIIEAKDGEIKVLRGAKAQ